MSTKMKNIQIDFLGNEIIIKLFEDNFYRRHREWIIPDIILMESIDWLIQKRKSKIRIIIEETDLCKFDLKLDCLHVRRKDIYSIIGYTLPMIVLDYLIDESERIHRDSKIKKDRFSR